MNSDVPVQSALPEAQLAAPRPYEAPTVEKLGAWTALTLVISVPLQNYHPLQSLLNKNA